MVHVHVVLVQHVEVCHQLQHLYQVLVASKEGLNDGWGLGLFILV